MSWRNSEILHSFVQAQPFEAEQMYHTVWRNLKGMRLKYNGPVNGG